MRVRFVALLVAAVAFGAAPMFVRADDTKKDEKAEKKCCGGDEKCDKDAGGCEGCGKSSKTFAKAIECKDCESSEKGPCEKCQTALKDGKVFFVPVSGMMCSSCEGAVSSKLEKIDGVAKYAVNHRFHGVALFIEPGKTVKLADIEKAFEGTKFKLDETVTLAGKYTLRLDGVTDEKVAASICETICKALGIENCKNCSKCFDSKTATYTIDTTGKNVTLKSLKEKLTENKLSLAAIEFHGPKADAGADKS